MTSVELEYLAILTASASTALHTFRGARYFVHGDDAVQDGADSNRVSSIADRVAGISFANATPGAGRWSVNTTDKPGHKILTGTGNVTATTAVADLAGSGADHTIHVYCRLNTTGSEAALVQHILDGTNFFRYDVSFSPAACGKVIRRAGTTDTAVVNASHDTTAYHLHSFVVSSAGFDHYVDAVAKGTGTFSPTGHTPSGLTSIQLGQYDARYATIGGYVGAHTAAEITAYYALVLASLT